MLQEHSRQSGESSLSLEAVESQIKAQRGALMDFDERDSDYYDVLNELERLEVLRNSLRKEG